MDFSLTSEQQDLVALARDFARREIAPHVADYDRDGLLDVYFCTYSFYQGLSDYGFPKPYYDAQNGPPNFLLRNNGNHAFEDVTAKAGLDISNNRFSFAPTWCDTEGMGWPDLYVANDFGRHLRART